MKKIIVTPAVHAQLMAQGNALGEMALEVGPELLGGTYAAYVAESIPIGIPVDYLDLGGYKTLKNKVELRTSPKIKRNDPCPCGSGLKAKKCKCMRMDNDL